MKLSLRFLSCALILLSASPLPVRAQNAPPRLPSATRARLETLLAAPALQSAHIGVSVRALGTVASSSQFPAADYAGGVHPEIFARDAARRFLPASNVKSFTCASALHYLGADFRFVTRIVGSGKRSGGDWKGDLSIVGRGDPALSSADLKLLARQIARSGIRRISGDIIGDGSAFGGETFGGRYPDGWTLDDAIWYYGPEISSLAIDRNQVDVTLHGTRPNRRARLFVSPALEGDFAVVNRVVTTRAARENSSALTFERAFSDAAIAPQITINGRIGLGQTRSEGIAVPDPPRRAARVFARELRRLGIQIGGRARSGKSAARAWELARHHSAPLRSLVKRCLKSSDNLYAEMLLRATALDHDGKLSPDMARRGVQLEFAWLQSRKVPTVDLQFTDGSGLSRYNLLTARASTQMLAAAQSLRDGDAFWNALPIAGIDGTLRNRLRATAAAGNVRAKTGTFSIASTLSGYVTTRDGHRLAVSVLSNFGRGPIVRKVQNDVFEMLAESRLNDD